MPDIAKSGYKSVNRLVSRHPLHRISPNFTLLISLDHVLLTVVSLIFFAAPSITDAWFILTHMTSQLGLLFQGSYMHDQLLTTASIGVSLYTFCSIIFAVVILEAAQYLAACGHSLETLTRPVRWGVCASILLAILYAGNLTPLPFVYFKF